MTITTGTAATIAITTTITTTTFTSTPLRVLQPNIPPIRTATVLSPLSLGSTRPPIAFSRAVDR
ncbi:hypothetical protein SAMD00023353_8500040 [Rosellinia necatrix]|uniref:Uncharacterized protein n=1 Tax=Rosellinia necatrix TaxID=77044 RepID=A0A1S8AAV3_ROSNE|nr:hypothetical protein SAMD00023353_8500040 [Rosellinia necatrix]